MALQGEAPELNEGLVEAMNETKKVNVSGAVGKGQNVVQVAVSNWRVDVDRDIAVVKDDVTVVAARR